MFIYTRTTMHCFPQQNKIWKNDSCTAFCFFFVLFLVFDFLTKYTTWLHCKCCTSWIMCCWYVVASGMIFKIFHTYTIVIYAENQFIFWYCFILFFFFFFCDLFSVRKDIPFCTIIASCACLGIFLAQNVRNNTSV